nr:unnamed protein product [Digitaria exilis]
MASPAKPHLVFFPFPAQGHITPAFQLASLLHRCHGFDVTFACPRTCPRDFPSFVRTTDPDDAVVALMLHLMECYRTVPSAIIFHTLEELERQVIGAMSDILPPIHAVGPLPLLLGQAGDPAGVYTSSSSLSKEDRACLDWLYAKRPSSVVFVNFGSVVKLADEQLVELAWGLANSGHEFLWVIRSDQQQAVLPPELVAETEGRGLVTSWCPQEAVLRHEAVGAFVTHCGWNSMLCWPCVGDQQTNSRMACTEWRVGVELGEDPSREEAEAAIRQVMEGKRGEELRRPAAEWKEKAALATRPGGSAWVNLEKVVNEVLAPLIDKL